MSSNFEKVKEFNKAFGLPNHHSPPPRILENKALVKLRMSLIEEEVDELRKAIQDKDMVEVADALADILYVVYGAGLAFGIDLDKAFDLVHKSNMSKLCQTEQEAKETIDWYKNQKSSPYDSPAYKWEPSVQKFIVYNESTGKILKNKYYQAVDLRSLV